MSSDSDIRHVGHKVVWTMSADVAEFYGVELEAVCPGDVGVRDDRRALLEAADRAREAT